MSPGIQADAFLFAMSGICKEFCLIAGCVKGGRTAVMTFFSESR